MRRATVAGVRQAVNVAPRKQREATILWGTRLFLLMPWAIVIGVWLLMAVRDTA